MERNTGLPFDLINDVSVKPIDSRAVKRGFQLSIGSVRASGNSTEIFVRIEASRVHLEDPTKPGVEITS